MKGRILLVLLLALGAMGVHAQGTTGMRFILGEMNRIYTKPAYGNYCMGLGLDHAPNNRLSLGFDAAIDVSGIGGSYEPLYNGSFGNTTYSTATRLYTLGYHTEFAFSSNTSSHFYMGTFLGLRLASQRWNLSVSQPGMEYIEKRLDTKATLVPVGLRFGFRGSVDGPFADLYVAVGYMIGGSKTLLAGNIPKNLAYATTSSMAITMGLAYGVGW